MSSGRLKDFSRLCIHTITTKPWEIETAVEQYAAEGVPAISVWREALCGRDPRRTGERIRAAGLAVVALVRGGFFPSVSAGKRKEALAENERALHEAAALGAPLLVLVPGADPRQPPETSRQQIREGIAALLPLAEETGVRLAIEPLHPMYADTRSAVNTLAQANDMAEYFASPWVGVAVDVYHLWWDPDLEREIARCGAHDNLFAFHICDWRVPTTDLLNDRGLMGEGCIPVRQIRGWVEEAGFTGYHEVEIFSDRYWAEDQKSFLRKIKKVYLEHS